MIRSRERRNRRRATVREASSDATIVATNRCERSFARSLGKPHASSSRGS